MSTDQVIRHRFEKEEVFFEGMKIGKIERNNKGYQFSGNPGGCSWRGHICGACRPTKDEAITDAICCAKIEIEELAKGIAILERAMEG